MPTTERGAARLFLVGLTAIGVLAAAGVLVHRGVGPLPDPEGCRAEVGDVVVELTTEQAENATTIAAIAVRRDLPARAVSIALATAYQESKIYNLDHGDRDSIGLFQQRPSQGWGTDEQIQDPVYATNKFYDALEQIDGYQDMRITEAAQQVQRSGFPEAYEDHAKDARALASALTGYSARGGFECVVRDPEDGPEAQKVRRNGLTPRAEAVRRDVDTAFGGLALGSFDRDGRALDILVQPVTIATTREGWATAQYLVAHADRLLVEKVIFDDRIWTAGERSEDGWRDYDAGSSDRVHVDVF